MFESGRYDHATRRILFLNCKRIAGNISLLKKKEASLIPTMKRIEVSDSFTGTSRRMASYTLG
jgi:hypothetical protein